MLWLVCSCHEVATVCGLMAVWKALNYGNGGGCETSVRCRMMENSKATYNHLPATISDVRLQIVHAASPLQRCGGQFHTSLRVVAAFGA
jgi:hypothetical protein